MADDKRISELDPADPLTGADEGETLQGGQNRRFSWGQVKNFVGNYFQLLSEKNASSGYAGLYGFKLLVKNAAGLFSSYIGHANTSNRTYTLQDRDGTIADLTDIAGVEAIARRPFFLGIWEIDTGAIVAPPASGDIVYDNATQIDALNLFLNYLTDGGTDVSIYLGLLTTGVKIVIQDKDDSANYQVWEISSTPSFSTPTWTIPVTLVDSGGTGTTNFPNNAQVFAAVFGGSGGSGGSGDVVGPSSATDGAVVLYDGTTGKLIKNSTILPTTVGIAIANLTNPSAITFIRINADNSVTARTPSEVLSDISGQPLDATLTALAGLSTGANKIPYSTGTDAFSQLTLDTDGTLAANSDTTLASQKAVKTYVDAQIVTQSSYAKIQAIWYHLNSF